MTPSCNLYLPFYNYGGEIGSNVLDQSGNNNHGVIVGAVPAKIPMVSGTELIINGDFTVNTSGWVGGNGTIAAVAGGHNGNCVQLTRAADVTQRAFQSNVGVAAGRRYKLSGWVKSGTSGNEEFQLDSWNGSGYDFLVSGTSSAEWVYYEVIGISTIADSSISLRKNTATAGTMLFDSISLQEVVGYSSLGWEFDGTDDQVTIGDVNSLVLGDGNMTVLAWVYPDYVPSTAQSIFSTGALGNPQPGWALRLNKTAADPNDISFQFLVSDAVDRQYGRTEGAFTGISSGRWHCIAGVLENTSATGVRLYHNGRLGVSEDATTLGTVNNTTAPIIGGGAAPLFDGNIGEIMVFGRAFSSIEVRNWFEQTRWRYGV